MTKKVLTQQESSNNHAAMNASAVFINKAEYEQTLAFLKFADRPDLYKVHTWTEERPAAKNEPWLWIGLQVVIEDNPAFYKGYLVGLLAAFDRAATCLHYKD
jgi:hypothetical protein